MGVRSLCLLIWMMMSLGSSVFASNLYTQKEFFLLSAENQKKYIRDIQSMVLNFENSFNYNYSRLEEREINNKYKIHLLKTLIESAYAKEVMPNCTVGGTKRKMYWGPQKKLLCPTHSNNCLKENQHTIPLGVKFNNTFQCGKIFNNVCVERISLDKDFDISRRCYDHKLSEISPEKYSEIKEAVENIEKEICKVKVVRNKVGCDYLQKRIIEMTSLKSEERNNAKQTRWDDLVTITAKACVNPKSLKFDEEFEAKKRVIESQFSKCEKTVLNEISWAHNWSNKLSKLDRDDFIKSQSEKKFEVDFFKEYGVSFEEIKYLFCSNDPITLKLKKTRKFYDEFVGKKGDPKFEKLSHLINSDNSAPESREQLFIGASQFMDCLLEGLSRNENSVTKCRTEIMTVESQGEAKIKEKIRNDILDGDGLKILFPIDLKMKNGVNFRVLTTSDFTKANDEPSTVFLWAKGQLENLENLSSKIESYTRYECDQAVVNGNNGHQNQRATD
jgi:hypothetical protein